MKHMKISYMASVRAPQFI